jgi:hypothetical protein
VATSRPPVLASMPMNALPWIELTSAEDVAKGREGAPRFHRRFIEAGCVIDRVDSATNIARDAKGARSPDRPRCDS